MRKLILIARTLFWGGFFIGGGLLATVQPAHPQLAVIDQANLSEAIVRAGHLVKQIAILTEQLNDMKTQGQLGSALWQSHITHLLRLLAELGQEGSILVAQDGSQTVWPEIFQEDRVFEKPGEWVEEERKRSHAVMTTQQDLMRLLEEHQHAFAADEEELLALQAAVDGAQGRNELIIAQAGMQARQIRETRLLRQLVMTLANSQIVSSAYAVNEKAAATAQGRAFLLDFDRELPPPPTRGDMTRRFLRYR